MAELSRFFADVAGDRLNTAAQMNRIFDQLLQEKDGVIRGLGNELAVTNSGLVAVDVNTGSAVMGGRFYENTASKNLALDAVTSGSKRYDRIVVRVNETARTMLLTVIKGVEGASPSVPAIDGTTDVLLAKILLDRSSGSYVYTVTDERAYCDGLLLPAIVTKLNTGTFSEDDVADGTTYKRVAAAKATAINGNTYSQDDVIDGTTYKRVANTYATRINAEQYFARYLMYQSSVIVSGTRYDVKSIVSLGSGVLVAGTNGTGKILRSTDNGFTWSIVQSASSPTSIVWVYTMYASTSVLYAIQNNANVAYKSSDGGATWSTLPANLPTSDLRCLFAFDENNFVIGDHNNGVIYYSSNGGSTWSTATGFTNGYCYGFGYIDGVLFTQASAGNIYKSTDYGHTWTEIPSSYKSYQIEKYLGIGSSIFAFGSNTSSKYQIIKSTDGGNTWSNVYQDLTYSSVGFSLALIDPQNTSVVYATGTAGLAVSPDSGTTWYAVRSLFLSNTITFVFSDSLGVAVVSRGNIYRIGG